MLLARTGFHDFASFPSRTHWAKTCSRGILSSMALRKGSRAISAQKISHCVQALVVAEELPVETPRLTASFARRRSHKKSLCAAGAAIEMVFPIDRMSLGKREIVY